MLRFNYRLSRTRWDRNVHQIGMGSVCTYFLRCKSEYIEEPYNDKRTDAYIQDNGKGPLKLAAEVQDALHHMKKGKTRVSDNIKLEEIEALGYFRIELIEKLIKDIFKGK